MRRFYKLTSKQKAVRMVNDLNKLRIGCGCSQSIGSDSNAYYIATIHFIKYKDKPVVGLYSPDAKFDAAHPWEAGTMVVEPFDKTKPPEFFITPYRNNWCYCNSNGELLESHRKVDNITFTGAFAYRDPSF